MKKHLLFALFTAFSTVGISLVDAQVTSAQLPPAVRDSLGAGAGALQQGDIAQARTHVDAAKRLAPDDDSVLSLEAAVLTYERKYDEARAVFLRLNQKYPGVFSYEWNLAEIDFLRGRYADARERLERMRETRQKDEMLIYKIALSHILEGSTAKAVNELNKIPFPSETAAYYYGRAAIEFANKDKDAAMSWVADAGKIFPLSHNLLFADSLLEKGFLLKEQVTGLIAVPPAQNAPNEPQAPASTTP